MHQYCAHQGVFGIDFFATTWAVGRFQFQQLLAIGTFDKWMYRWSFKQRFRLFDLAVF
jgi:hypothetical protein